MTYQSEHELEELLIRQLVAQGYDRVGIRDEEDLKALDLPFDDFVKYMKNK